MRILLALSALAMPLIGWLSNLRVFGPTNGEISDRYPTLIVAAGYAFAIWGPIFLLDVLFAIRQIWDRNGEERLAGIRPWVFVGFVLTSAWMIVFSRQWFWLALAILWASLICFLIATIRVSTTARMGRAAWWQWLPLSLHAGWISLAAFLNLAQVIVAFRLFSTTQMLPWTLVLFGLAAALILVFLYRTRGNIPYALAAVWGLIGVSVKQRDASLEGAHVAAFLALALAALVVLTSLAGLMRRRASAS
jgi:hypothetical protein